MQKLHHKLADKHFPLIRSDWNRIRDTDTDTDMDMDMDTTLSLSLALVKRLTFQSLLELGCIGCMLCISHKDRPSSHHPS